MPAPDADILKKIIETLKPLTSEERRRILDAALAFLGEGAADAATERNPAKREAESRAGGTDLEANRRDEPKGE